jgi:hypothetical protein
LPYALRSSFLRDQYTNIERSITVSPLPRTGEGNVKPSFLLEECGERVYRLVQLGVLFDAYPKIYMLVNIGSKHVPIGAGRGK